MLKSCKKFHDTIATTTLTLGGFKYGDLALDVMGFSNETVNYGHEFYGTLDPRLTANDKIKLQIYPLVREGGPR
jgi:hypothetical protein